MNQDQLRRILKRYFSCWEELKKARIIRTNNLTADMGEYFACKKLKLKRAAIGNTGYDARDEKGSKYEVKTRKTRSADWVIDIFPLYNDEPYQFDYLVLVNLDYHYWLERIVVIPLRLVKKYRRNSKIYFSEKLSDERGVIIYYYGRSWKDE